MRLTGILFPVLIDMLHRTLGCKVIFNFHVVHTCTCNVEYMYMCMYTSLNCLLHVAESSSATLGSQPASTHKYVVTATIIRDSWPIADTAWSCIADIKMAEEAAEKAAGTGGKGDGKKTPSTSKGSKGKKGKGGGGSKESGDRVQSSVSLSSIDASKPHWTLRVALRQSVSTVILKLKPHPHILHTRTTFHAMMASTICQNTR